MLPRLASERIIVEDTHNAHLEVHEACFERFHGRRCPQGSGGRRRFRAREPGHGPFDDVVDRGGTVSDPQGSDRIHQDVPIASATGDNSDSASSFDDVPADP